MKPFFRTLLSKRLRGVLGCLLAVATQVSLPILHGTHSDAISSIESEAAAAGAWRSPGDHHPDDSGSHESATCPQCRVVSQLKTIVTPETHPTAPVVSASWMGDTKRERAGPRSTRDSAAPRAPPLPA